MSSVDLDSGRLSFWHANSRCDGENRFVVTSQASTGRPFPLRSYDNPQSPSPTVDCKVWEAARATTATSPFFERFGVEVQGSLGDFGASDFYNPVDTVYHEARILWPEREIILVSIGAGAAPRNKFSGRLGASVETAERISVHAEASATAFALQHTGLSTETSLYRFSAETLADIGLGEHDVVADVEAATQRYLRSMEMQDRIHRCVGDLSEISREGSFYFPVLTMSIKLMLLQKVAMPLSNSSHTELMNAKFERLLNGFFPSTCL